MVKAIIFDLGGVILKHKATLIGYILSQVFSISEEEGMKIWNEYRVRLLTGELSSKEFLMQIRNRTGNSYSLEELLKKWRKLYIANAEVNWEVLDFVKQLKEKYDVYLLSDTIDTHDQFNKKRGIYNHFKEVFKSFEEKLSKAQGLEIYLRVLEKINIEPNECIIIDDLEEQVKAAESLGMQGIVFKNLEQLKEELRKKKVTL